MSFFEPSRPHKVAFLMKELRDTLPEVSSTARSICRRTAHRVRESVCSVADLGSSFAASKVQMLQSISSRMLSSTNDSGIGDNDVSVDLGGGIASLGSAVMSACSNAFLRVRGSYDLGPALDPYEVFKYDSNTVPTGVAALLKMKADYEIHRQQYIIESDNRTNLALQTAVKCMMKYNRKTNSLHVKLTFNHQTLKSVVRRDGNVKLFFKLYLSSGKHGSQKVVVVNTGNEVDTLSVEIGDLSAEEAQSQILRMKLFSRRKNCLRRKRCHASVECKLSVLFSDVNPKVHFWEMLDRDQNRV